MDELTKIGRVAARVVPEAPHETFLVMDATYGSNGLAQARQFAQSLNLTGIILTKMDGTAKGGVVLAIAKELELPVRYVGIGESVDDLLEFDAEEFVDALIV
jgi:fused signal recognition particle receptor